MGRGVGDGIHGSDAARDYFASITDRLERELAYWLSPEQVMNEGWWCADVLAVIELILLFEQHVFGSSVYISDVKAVKRWREVFLSVWDGDWQDNQSDSAYALGTVKYRQQHRTAIIKIFDRLESIAFLWQSLSQGRGETELTSLSSDYSLPYFSIHSGRMIWYLITQLVKDILYNLSSEQRAYALAFNVEDVWVAVDLLGLLCQKYERSPGVKDEHVRGWRETTVEIGRKFLGGGGIAWDESDPLYQEVMQAFGRLETAAQKYPPEDWWE